VFTEAKDDGSVGDIWSYRSCKAPVISSPPTNQHPVFFTGRTPFPSPNQQCQSTEGKISHSMDLLTRRSLRVFQLCHWPLIAPGDLGGGLPCLASALWCQYPYILLSWWYPRLWAKSLNKGDLHPMEYCIFTECYQHCIGVLIASMFKFKHIFRWNQL